MTQERGTEIQLYDSVEAIAAAYERRKAEIVRATNVAVDCNVELKRDYLTDHKQEAWRDILEKSNARQWMTTKQESDVTRMLYDKPKDLPEITVDGLREWLLDLVTACPDMLRDLCREAFEVLTPQARRGRDYKSNADKREIPRSGRVVLPWMCDREKWVDTPRLSYGRRQPLNVLDRVFALLAGRAKPEDNYQTGEMQTAVGLCEKASESGESEVETFWGRLKMHKNGNLHIWLTRPELVKRLVEVAAGKNIGQAAA